MGHLIKVFVDALDIPVEVHLSVGVIDGHALGEVNDRNLGPFHVGDDVELIVVSVDETVLGKVEEDFYAHLEESLYFVLAADPLDVAESVSFDEGHDDGVAVSVDGLGGGEVVFVEQLHEHELPDGAESGQVEPAVARSVLNVLSVLLDAPEGVPPEAREFEHNDVSVGSDALVDV